MGQTSLNLLFTVVVYGLLGIGITFMVQQFEGTVLQISLSFMGAASGSLNGIIILGAFFPCANWIGAIVGGVTSYGFMLWLGIAKYSVLGSPETLNFPTSTCQSEIHNHSHPAYNITDAPYYLRCHEYSLTNITTTPADEKKYGLDRFYSLSYLWYSALGSIICITVGLLTSLLTGLTDPKEVDTKYLISVFDRLFCCLPRRLRSYLQCGLGYSEELHEVKNEEHSVSKSDSALDEMHIREVKSTTDQSQEKHSDHVLTHLL